MVSRAIFQEMQKNNISHVFLDITHKDKEFLENRFPTIYSKCLSYGIDMSKDYIPVAPSQHYSMGGIKTDEWANTNILGFYAVGEAACNGIHGANRLASNSLLEGLVFGRRIGKIVKENLDSIKIREGFKPKIKNDRKYIEKEIDCRSLIKRLQSVMNNNVGIIRTKESLNEAMETVMEISSLVEGVNASNVQMIELKNMLILSAQVIKAALTRKESRGAHYRSDYPDTDDINWLRNIVFRGEPNND